MIFSKAKGQKRGFIFTKRTQSKNGMFATILSVLSLLVVIDSIYKAYKFAGNIPSYLGAAGFWAVVFAFISFIMSIIGLKEPDSFRLFPIIALVLSILDLFAWGFCFYLGVG